LPPDFKVKIEDSKCIRCKVCVKQCSFGALFFDAEEDRVWSKDTNCVACRRCAILCPTQCIDIIENPLVYKKHSNWTAKIQKDILKQAETGGILLTGTGCDMPYPIYWDHILLDASQVTNPSIDPLREPMELRTFLGKKPDLLEAESRDGSLALKTELSPQVMLETPIMFAAMSLGAISFNCHEALARAAAALYEAPIFIDDSPALSVLNIRAKARRLQAEQKRLGLVIIDYLQLIQGRSRAENRQQEISEITRSLKELAKELRVPVVALSQLSRAVEQRERKRPQLADLRESGAIEQDADLVMFLYRDEMYNERTETPGTAEVIIGKQRNGPTGSFELVFLKEYTRFENLAKGYNDKSK